MRGESISARAVLAACCLAVAVLAGPAVAQDPSEDWDLVVDPVQQTTLATLDFGDNLIALRCRGGALDMLITGTPATSASSRTVRVTAGAIAGERQVWLTQPNQPFLTPPEPNRLARQLKAGGQLDLRLEAAPDVSEPARRYRLPVPASAASVDRVLTACGQPLVDPRDLLARIEGEPVWTTPPTAAFPPGARARGATEGTVRLNCVVAPANRLSDCRVESEQPPGVGFAQSALAGAAAAQLDTSTDQAGRVVRTTIRFRPE